MHPLNYRWFLLSIVSFPTHLSQLVSHDHSLLNHYLPLTQLWYSYASEYTYVGSSSKTQKSLSFWVVSWYIIIKIYCYFYYLNLFFERIWWHIISYKIVHFFFHTPNALSIIPCNKECNFLKKLFSPSNDLTTSLKIKYVIFCSSMRLQKYLLYRKFSINEVILSYNFIRQDTSFIYACANLGAGLGNYILDYA